MLCDLSSVDPGISSVKHCTSVPFYSIETFEDLCSLVLFKYIEVQSSDPATFTVDFRESPISLFAKSVNIGFLLDEDADIDAADI